MHLLEKTRALFIIYLVSIKLSTVYLGIVCVCVCVYVCAYVTVSVS